MDIKLKIVVRMARYYFYSCFIPRGVQASLVNSSHILRITITTYVYIHIYIYIYTHTYVCKEREREINT